MCGRRSVRRVKAKSKGVSIATDYPTTVLSVHKTPAGPGGRVKGGTPGPAVPLGEGETPPTGR